MSDYPGAAWLARYRERVNGDAELKVIGDWFTTTFALTFGDTRYAVKVEKGQITDIVTPKLDTRTPFGFRAPVSVWRKFLSPDPPPLFHDFFAMLMRVPEFVLEGDGLVAMQNARALHRMMNIMRETGAPQCLTSSRSSGATSRSTSRARRHRVHRRGSRAGRAIAMPPHRGRGLAAVPPSCSTTPRSRVASASSRSTCRTTAARRRPTAGG